MPLHRRQRPPGQRRLLLGHLRTRRRHHETARRHSGADDRRWVSPLFLSCTVALSADSDGRKRHRGSIPHGCTTGIAHRQIWPQDVGIRTGPAPVLSDEKLIHWTEAPSCRPV